MTFYCLNNQFNNAAITRMVQYSPEFRLRRKIYGNYSEYFRYFSQRVCVFVCVCVCVRVFLLQLELIVSIINEYYVLEGK